MNNLKAPQFVSRPRFSRGIRGVLENVRSRNRFQNGLFEFQTSLKSLNFETAVRDTCDANGTRKVRKMRDCKMRGPRRVCGQRLRFRFDAGKRGEPRFSSGVCSCLRRSMNQRPAGPGGVSVLYMAHISINRPPRGESSVVISTSLPLARSASIMGSGNPPNPKPARRNASLAPRWERRQTLGILRRSS